MIGSRPRFYRFDVQRPVLLALGRELPECPQRDVAYRIKAEEQRMDEAVDLTAIDGEFGVVR